MKVRNIARWSKFHLILRNRNLRSTMPIIAHHWLILKVLPAEAVKPVFKGLADFYKVSVKALMVAYHEKQRWENVCQA